MTDTNATTLRNALAAAIKSHVADSGLNAKDAAANSGVQLSRLYQVLRGDVEKISSDALVNILGGFGYRLTGINGSGSGTEIVLSLDKDEGQVLPEIEKPQTCEGGDSSCGPVTSFDSEGVPLCDTCTDGLIADSEADPDANRVVADDE